MYTRNKAATAFIMKISEAAVTYGVTVTITNARSVYAKDGSATCCGVFVPPYGKTKGKIRVASQGQTTAEVLLSLAHEYIHLRQWFNKEKIYHTDNYLKLERNTENRALGLMERHGFSPRIMKQARSKSKRYLADLKSGVLVS